MVYFGLHVHIQEYYICTLIERCARTIKHSPIITDLHNLNLIDYLLYNYYSIILKMSFKTNKTK